MPKIDTPANGNIWLAFDSPEDEEASHEGNIYQDANGTYRFDWYHNAVGQVTSVSGFETYDSAAAFATGAGYEDYSS